MSEKVWVVAKLGLVGIEMMKFLKSKNVAHVGSSRSEADITDKESIRSFFNKHHPTHIINCSANVNVDLAEDQEKDLAYDVNVKGVVNLAELAKEYEVKLIHIGTDYVFDGEKETDYEESDPISPINQYGITKLEGEQKMLEMYPEAVCVRTASLFGAAKPGLVSGIIRMLETKDEAKGIIDQTSSPTYVPHLVQAIWAIRNEKGIFHFVNKGTASRFELVEEVKNYANEKGRAIKCNRIIGMQSAEFGRAAARPKRSVLSTHKIEEYLPFPIPSWQAALREYLREIGWIID